MNLMELFNNPQNLNDLATAWKALINVTFQGPIASNIVLQKMDHSRPLFRLFLSFQTNITILTTNKCEEISIQYTGMGFELTTFGTRVSSHKH